MNFFLIFPIVFQHLISTEKAFKNEKAECEKLREINLKLEFELREARELEKSHRYHLATSREIIGNLQETVSQLIYLKRDTKKLKDEIAAKNAIISAAESVQYFLFIFLIIQILYVRLQGTSLVSQ